MDMEEAKKEADMYNAQSNSNITPGLGGMVGTGHYGVCPSCGRCPTCGRGGYYYPQPYWWNQQQPYYTNAPTCSHM